MQPLNPFLQGFFRSTLPSQCSPVQHHVLLVPTTEVLLNAKDRDTNTPYFDIALNNEDFLASHVLRVPNGVAPTSNGGKDGTAEGSTLRESKSKAKQYPTINGRIVVVKDSHVYGNKGFKTLSSAQLLHDAIYYPMDTPDAQQWLIYYISRPLVGHFQLVPTIPAVISDEPSKERRMVLAEATGSGSATEMNEKSKASITKDIKGFTNLLNQYPMIAKHMQGGLEKIIRDFVATHDGPITTRRSRKSSISSQRSTPSLNDSISSIRSSLSGGSSNIHPTSLELEPEEEMMRTALEAAVDSTITLFQSVDRTQLTSLGANTALTGIEVERMLEKYLTEQLHEITLFPRVCSTRKAEDHDLEKKIRGMGDVDIAQVGIPIEGDDSSSGHRVAKRELVARLNRGVEVFKRMGVGAGPHEMLNILLETQKTITEAPVVVTTTVGADKSASTGRENAEKKSSPLTISADVLVSMLLVVVIRSGVRHLHSRLLYMRYFIFTDEVESGEQGYALATLEAVLAHLSSSSQSLRRASKQNRVLWRAARNGDVKKLEAMFGATDSEGLADVPEDDSEASDPINSWSEDVTSNGTAFVNSPTTFTSQEGTLGHVFPFQLPPTPAPVNHDAHVKKRVSMASLPRSHSTSSVYSSRSHSRHLSVDSAVSFDGDLSVEKLAQTQDIDGNSVLMMSIDSGQRASLRFLLSLPAHFRSDFVLDDMNNDGTTLLIAAVSSGNRALAEDLISYLERNTTEEELTRYFAVQDGKGRCVAHYLFHQPHLIYRFGKKVPWRLKDRNGQTPLFALCRSYDHEEYHSMVGSALALATETQSDGQGLHVDDHVDAKGNTLLHIVNDIPLTMTLLTRCDIDVNAANDRNFTALMLSSKYGRIDLVGTLFQDPRVDVTLKDFRGLTAVELAKDDDIRNRLDDMILLSHPEGKDGRTTAVVRSFFIEDGTIRFVLKSGSPGPNGTQTITTSRRSMADFENLAKLLSLECPASWLPSTFNLPSPLLIPSKPSRAVLRDVQIRLNNFFHNLLTHGTFRVHELVWEFFLVPDLNAEMIEERSKRKAESRIENVVDDFEPITDIQEVENFVAFARDQIRGVHSGTRRMMRAVNRHRMIRNDHVEAQHHVNTRLGSLLFLPIRHATAYDRYTKTLLFTDACPIAGLYYHLPAVQSSSAAIQAALDRPAYLIGSMAQAQRALDRHLASIARSHRWTPNIGGLFEGAKRAAARDGWDRAGRARCELDTLACELRYTQQTVAAELAAWQDEHVVAGRTMLKTFAREMLVKEREKLEALQRAQRLVS